MKPLYGGYNESPGAFYVETFWGPEDEDPERTVRESLEAAVANGYEEEQLTTDAWMVAAEIIELTDGIRLETATEIVTRWQKERRP